MKKIMLSGLVGMMLASSAFGYSYDNYEDDELKSSKITFNILQGVSNLEAKALGAKNDVNLYSYGAQITAEKRLGESNFYLGVGADFLKTEKIDKTNAKVQSIGFYPTLGYNFTNKFSTTGFLGIARNDFDKIKDDGLVYGLSFDYKITESMNLGLMLRHTEYKLKVLDKEVAKIDLNSAMVKIGFSF